MRGEIDRCKPIVPCLYTFFTYISYIYLFFLNKFSYLEKKILNKGE